jgi:hypothetical protein
MLNRGLPVEIEELYEHNQDLLHHVRKMLQIKFALLTPPKITIKIL